MMPATFGQASTLSTTPSRSVSGGGTQPWPLGSALAGPGSRGQASWSSPIPSPSLSTGSGQPLRPGSRGRAGPLSSGQASSSSSTPSPSRSRSGSDGKDSLSGRSYGGDHSSATSARTRGAPSPLVSAVPALAPSRTP